MKKSLFVMLGLTMLVSQSLAQLTLDHTFSGHLSSSFLYIDEPLGLYYPMTYNNTNTVNLYNSNYSLYKTISIDLPTGFSSMTVTSLGRHLVNTDDKAEFFVKTRYSTNVDMAIIINEDGAIIQDLGQSTSISCPGVYKAGTQLRLNINKSSMGQNYQYSYQTDVYICHGNYNAVSSFENDPPTMQPYPNPTTTLINIPYRIEKGTVSTINIYNINGQFIESYNIGSDFEMITIDVNNYTKGIYVYEYNGISNRFVIQ